jgi:hypothetical protein
MRIRFKSIFFRTMPCKTMPFHLAVAVLILGLTHTSFAQIQPGDRPCTSIIGYHILNDGLRPAAQGRYPISHPGGPSFSMPETNFSASENNASGFNDNVLREAGQSTAYDDLIQRQRIREAQEAAVRARTEEYCAVQREATPQANPDEPDQSERLKNSKDRDFILHNFRTMYIDARDARYFGSDQLKAALGRNKGFEKLNIRIVDDRRVADAVLKVGYTFAWDYPFELTHQNTTIVLLSGKGEGPFSGPLGAADLARNFVNAAKPWRETKKDKSDH